MPTLFTRALLLTIGALAAAAGSLALWDPFDVDDRRHIRRMSRQAVRFVQSDLAASLQARLDALVRVASICATSGDAAYRYCEGPEHQLITPDDTSILSIHWVDRARGLQSTPLRHAISESGPDANSDPELRSALQTLVEHEPASAVIVPEDPSQGDRMRIVVPALRAGGAGGFLIALIDTTTAFEEMLAGHTGHGFVISIGDASGEIHRTSGPSGTPDEAFTEELPLRFLGRTWTIRAWPDAEMFEASRSALPELAVILGALLGLMVMLAATSTQLARRQAAEVRRVQQEFVATLVRSQDKERRRLAREMHDSTAQTLSMVAIIIDNARRRLQARVDEKQAEELKQGAELLDRAMFEIRTMSYLLHPPLLDELGLSHALSRLVDGFARRARIDVRLEVDADLPRLQPDVELTLFRVAQEALTNVHRHSGSRSATLRLFRDARFVTLEVIDHGRGIPKELGQARDNVGSFGVGLAGMQECVREIGGTFDLRSTENGTLIRAVLPLVSAYQSRTDSMVRIMPATARSETP